MLRSLVGTPEEEQLCIIAWWEAYMKRIFIIATAATLMVPALTNAAEIKVLSTQATEEAYRELVPQFEKATGHGYDCFHWHARRAEAASGW
jgi:hypothetical protein